MNFAKLDDLTRRRALYFARADRVSDDQEGIASPFIEDRQLSEIKSRVPPGAVLPPATEFRRHIGSLRQQMYLSCWHMAQCESAAMWNLYAKGQDDGVVIRSTFGRLEQALPHEWDHAIHAGKVRYLDDETETFQTGNAFVRYLHKHRRFADERELRVIFASHSDDEAPGFHVPVDLAMLIECIYVSPTASSAFVPDVERVLSDNGLRLPVMRSRLPA